MGIRLIGMTEAEVAHTSEALAALARHVPEEHAHACRALHYIMMTPWTWGLPPTARAYTGAPWGRGMMLAHRPTTMPLEELAVCIAHEARHIVLHADGSHSYRYHAFGHRPPTPAELLADPIYARDEEVRRALSAGLAGEGARPAAPPAPPSPDVPRPFGWGVARGGVWPFVLPPWMR